MNQSNINPSRKALKQQLLTQQISVFQHLSTMVRNLSERIIGQDLSLTERRLMQQELASLKRVTQSTRSRLKTSHRSSRTRHDSS